MTRDDHLKKIYVVGSAKRGKTTGLVLLCAAPECAGAEMFSRLTVADVLAEANAHVDKTADSLGSRGDAGTTGRRTLRMSSDQLGAATVCGAIANLLRNADVSDAQYEGIRLAYKAALEAAGLCKATITVPPTVEYAHGPLGAVYREALAGRPTDDEARVGAGLPPLERPGPGDQVGAHDGPFVAALADALERIETNYRHEGAGPGSRFAGERLALVQARFAVQFALQQITC